MMKKVIILSYSFPPCSLTAAQRVFGWAQYLKQDNIYPTIITRNWDVEIKNPQDAYKTFTNEIKYVKHEEYEVYYLPYKPSWRDKIYVRYGDTKFILARKALTFLGVFFQNWSLYAVPYRSMYSFTRQLLKKNDSYEALIISGNPFIQFRFGYLLAKEFGIKWVADYRDAWTTSKINGINRGISFKINNFIERFFEKKWVKSASLVTASSQPIADEITKLTGVRGKALYNGFIKEDFDFITQTSPFELFTITYVGTLYYGQQIEMFCEAYKKFIDNNLNVKSILLFVGLAFNENQKSRVIALLSGYENYYSFTNRISRNETLEIEVRSHVLLYVAWKGFEGIIASKIYEYIASGSFILITPSDNGSIEEILQRSGCGTSTNTIEETYSFLNDFYKKYLSGEKVTNNTSNVRVLGFSRENQVKKLSEFINELNK